MHDPTTDAGYTTAGASPTANTIDQLLALEGESIFELLDVALLAQRQQQLFGLRFEVSSALDVLRQHVVDTD